MGMYDLLYSCVDNQVTRGAAGYAVKICETIVGNPAKTPPAAATQVAAVVAKPLWQQVGNSRYVLRLAAISGAAAVCLGAYGVHRRWEVDGKSKEEIELAKKQFDVANNYHVYHTLVLMAVPLARFPMVSGALFTTGIVLFCGPIYYSSVSGDKSYNSLTPFGGISFIIAWLTLAL